jgi:hypothetical protein
MDEPVSVEVRRLGSLDGATLSRFSVPAGAADGVMVHVNDAAVGPHTEVMLLPQASAAVPGASCTLAGVIAGVGLDVAVVAPGVGAGGLPADLVCAYILIG